MTYPITFTFTQINSHLAQMIETQTIDPDLVFSEDASPSILDVTSETTSMIPFRNALRERGIDIDDNLWLTCRDNPPLDLMSVTIRDERSIELCSELTDAIFDEYETPEPTTTLWDDLDISGDDCVDYCSSYLDALWTILADMTK